MNTPRPSNEIQRLKALQSYQILDTLPEEQFDRLTKLASLICEAPITLISMIDENRQWFKSNIGLDGVTETPRDISFCQHAIMNDELFEIEDATKDDRFKDNVLVTGNPDIRFYAGQPIIDTNGYVLGTLCVIDRKPQKLNEKQKSLMAVLAKEIAYIFEAQQKNKEKDKFEALFNMSADFICIAGMDGYFKKINPAIVTILGYEQKELLEKPFVDFVHPDDIELTLNEVKKLSTGKKTLSFNNRFKTKKGHYILINWAITPDTTTGEMYAIGRDITEKKAKEDQLFKSNQLQNAILNNTDYAIISTTTEGIITQFNSGAEKMLGYASDEIDNITSPAIFHDLNEVVARAIVLSKELNTNIEPGFNVFVAKSNLGMADINEWTYIRKDGSKITVELSVTALRNESNEINGYLGVAKNITQEKINKENLIKSNQLQKAILNGSDYAIITSSDPEGIITSFNKGAENMLGYSADEMIGIQSPAILHDFSEVITRAKVLTEELQMDIKPGIDVFHIKSRLGHSSDINEWTYIRKDGSRIFVELSISTLKDNEQNIIGYLGIAKDITELKENQNKLNSSLHELAQFKNALDSSSIVAITDQKGKIILVNDNFCKISKYSREELIGQDHRIINSGFHSKEFIRNIWLTIANGEIWKGEIKNKAKDGTFYWVDTTIVPFFDDKGKPFQYMAIRTEITGRKLGEERLNEYLDQIEQKNKDLDQFSYIVSHDLKAPLRAINNLAEWIVDDLGEVPEEVSKNIATLRGRVHRMEAMINGILEYSKIGRKKLPIEQIDLNILVNNVIESLSKPPLFQINIQNNLPIINAENILLYQIFANLISNAIKYNDKEKGIIDITFEDKKDSYIFSVKDNGPGILPEYFDKVFGIFQTIEARDTRESTGIGLSLVKKIIDEKGGKIWIESDGKSGSEFKFELAK